MTKREAMLLSVTGYSAMALSYFQHQKVHQCIQKCIRFFFKSN